MKGLPKQRDSLAREFEKLTSGLRSRDEAFERLFWYIPLPKIQDFHADRKKTKVLFGGVRSGKTRAGMVELVSLYTNIQPPGLRYRFPTEQLSRDDWLRIERDSAYARQIIEQWTKDREWPLMFPYDKYDLTRPQETMIVVVDYEHHWPEVFQKYLLMPGFALLPWEFSKDYDEMGHRYTAANKATITAESPGTTERSNRMRGTGKNYILIDEKSSRYAYAESLSRTISTHGTVACTMCPQDGYTWQSKEFWSTTRNEEGTPFEVQPKGLGVYVISIHDNPTLPEEDRDIALESMTPQERQSREKGFFSERIGDPAFEPAETRRLKEGVHGGERVRWEDVQVDLNSGTWTGTLHPAMRVRVDNDPVWQVWAEPTVGHVYLLVADSSEGRDVRANPQSATIYDFTCATLLTDDELAKLAPEDLLRLEADTPQVAQLKAKLNPCELFADQCALMGQHYGTCLVCFESLGQSAGVMLARLRLYPNLYLRKPEDTVIQSLSDRIGFHTGKYTKPKLVDNMRAVLKLWAALGLQPVHSKATQEQLEHYSEIQKVSETGEIQKKYQAMSGYSDDCVMDLMIACFVGKYDRNQLTVMSEKTTLSNDAENEGLFGVPVSGNSRGPLWRMSQKPTRPRKQLPGAWRRRRLRQTS